MITSKFINLLHSSIKVGGFRSIRAASDMKSFNFETLSVSSPKEYVYKVELNRPKKLNALNNTMWEEIGKCFQELDSSPECRVIVLTGAGKAFCSGIDLQDAMSMGSMLAEHDDVARKSRALEKKIKQYQDSFLSIEKCQKPVIAAIHGACVGGGFNMICGADIRYCSSNAWFSLKEVDIGMAADVGALQWFSKIIGSESLVREMAFTARRMQADEALQCGLVNRLFKDDETLFKESLAVAEEISKKSPVAVQTTKKTIIYSRDHQIQEGLDYVRGLNQTMLQSEDFINAAVAQATKGEPAVFSKL
ncbi:delta(3,5)-Delta(2,4)-dienoyl-CoA isomerase, mitochondrial [Microplitis mediator]|uniref:delta(3,5)-Delta(2,4)-dienoyl-CoA isomerase, mitochondrial n=1 Tax=Microplitis mediator TaxID=375433 RepID=UPI002554E7C9|nr:delta(3,5)-Delta(2,4)-dienoyl-CoA isomerase, mitochondrial [Microplitis mediator]